MIIIRNPRMLLDTQMVLFSHGKHCARHEAFSLEDALAVVRDASNEIWFSIQLYNGKPDHRFVEPFRYY